MAKEIILYNLKDTVTDEEYKKWCEDYKGPLLLNLGATKSFTLVKMLGGIKGNGQKGNPPEETASPYKYIGIMDLSSLQEWKKDSESKAFKEEFFPQWFSKWVADFYVLAGEEVYYGESDQESRLVQDDIMKMVYAEISGLPISGSLEINSKDFVVQTS